MGCWGRVGSDMDRRDWTAQCNIHKYRYHTYNWTGLKSPSGQLVVWGPVVWNSIGFPYERDYYLGVPRSNPNIPAHQSANCNPKLCLKMAQIWKPPWRLFCQGVTHQTSQVQSCWTRTPPQKHTHTTSQNRAKRPPFEDSHVWLTQTELSGLCARICGKRTPVVQATNLVNDFYRGKVISKERMRRERRSPPKGCVKPYS